MSFIRSTYLVAWREATERARSRAYIVSTIFTLVLLGGLMAVVVLVDQGPSTYEVGLSGELRTVAQLPARLREAAKLGFRRVLVPATVLGGDPPPDGLHVIAVRSLAEALVVALESK